MRIEHKCFEYEITDDISVYEIIVYNKSVSADMAEYYVSVDGFTLQFAFGVETHNRFSYTDLMNLYHDGYFDHYISVLEDK